MKATLKYYKNQQEYEKDFPNKVEAKASITVALKEEIRKVRGTQNFIGFKVFDKYGDLKYKLPGY